jgi:hypothetical protein
MAKRPPLLPCMFMAFMFLSTLPVLSQQPGAVPLVTEQTSVVRSADFFTQNAFGLAANGEATDSSLGGSHAGSFSFYQLTDTEQVLYRAGLTGTTTNNALFLKSLAASPDVISVSKHAGPRQVRAVQ